MLELTSSTTGNKVLLDTDTIVSALVEGHPAHDPAFAWLERAKNKEVTGYMSAHSLAEVYAVLTKAYHVSPADVLRMIETSLIANLEVVALTEAEYQTLLKHLTSLNIIGGNVYDGIHAFAAWKVDVDYVVTGNKSHFDSVYPTQVHKIILPTTTI